MIRLLFIGDVVGRSGRAVVLEQVPILRARWGLDFVVVNGENAAGGLRSHREPCSRSSSPSASTR